MRVYCVSTRKRKLALFAVMLVGVMMLAPAVPTRADVIELCENISASQTWISTHTYVILENCNVNLESLIALTIQAGTVIKFQNNSSLVVNGILNSLGTATNRVVFTSYEDDAYGGDTNNDGSASSPSPGSWKGINLKNNTITWDYSLIQYASSGITIPGSLSQALIEHNIFHKNLTGITIASDQVTIRLNDFVDNSSYGIYKAISPAVNAKDNYWGSVYGPFHPITNPGGAGDQVSDFVDYEPFLVFTADVPLKDKLFLPVLRKDVP